MKKSPLQIIGNLIFPLGIILAAISVVMLGNARISYKGSCEFYSTWDGKQYDGTYEKVFLEMNVNNPQNLTVEEMDKAAWKVENDLKDGEIGTARRNLQQKREELSDAMLFWGGGGCGGGIAMAVIGIVMQKRGKAIRASQKLCPFCSEIIKAEAVKCRFCSADLPAQSASQPAKPPTLLPQIQPSQKPVDPFAMTSAPKFLRQENGAIHFECGYCNQAIEIDESGGGVEIKCPECGEPQKVPTA